MQLLNSKQVDRLSKLVLLKLGEMAVKLSKELDTEKAKIYVEAHLCLMGKDRIEKVLDRLEEEINFTEFYK